MADSVVITGAGLRSCLGNRVDEVWKKVADGVSGIGPVPALTGLPDPIGGVVELAEPANRRISRFQQLLLESTKDAVTGAFGEDGAVPADTAIVIGTGGGGFNDILTYVQPYLDRGWRGIDRLMMVKTLPNMAAGAVAAQLGCNGPCLTITTACAASTDAMIVASDLIRSGRSTTVIAGGVEAWLTEVTVGALSRLEVVSKRPSTMAAAASRPFDAGRDGMVPSDGAGVVVLEAEATAAARGAPILGRFLGGASTCDAAHLVAGREDGEPAAAAVRNALANAGLGADDIDHVSLHGTSTRMNDALETRALRKALGRRADEIPMTASKSVLGHAGGACGVLEAIITLEALRHGYVPPTINLDDPDPECDLDYTPLVGRPHAMEVALSTNFGFGGQNAAIVLGLPS